jgi:Ca-activated chloride channel family protein
MNIQWIKWLSALATVPFFMAAAQVPQRELPTKEQRPTVTVPFFVVDGHGNPTSATTQINVSVLDNKVPPQSVVAIQAAKELPLRLGVLIDTSYSESRSGLYQPGVQAISELLSQVLKAPEDRVFLLSFTATPNGTDFMSRDEFLKFKLDVTPGGATALFDALYFACKERMQGDPTQPARRVLVILSDGGDNSSHVNHDDAIAAAQKAGTAIFAVSTSENPNANLDSRRLEQFADKTGGHAFLHLSRKDLPKVFSSIREQIENMYAVTFVPADIGRSGEYHSIELKMTSDKQVKLRAPKGYYVTAGAQ